MRISTVALENIRSHQKTETHFKKGFNCLIGGLGTGKSSILYAIDFAFFGDPLSRSYQYLLREGENAGKVTVEFLLNGKSYRVERGLTRRGKGIGQSAEDLKLFEEDKLIASMRNEAVAEQLKTITGLNKEIFREVVWIRQEHLKELLDVAPRERQKRLDELFGLSDYEVAWNNVRGIQREYEGEKKAIERDFDVLSIEKLEADYHKSVEDFSVLQNEILDLNNRLQEAENALQDASVKLQSLEQLRKQTEKLSRKEAELQTKVANTEDMCGRIANEIQGKATTIKQLEKQLQSLEEGLNVQKKQLQEINLPPDSTVERLGHQLASYDEQITSIRSEQELARKETQASKQRLSNLAGEKSECPVCLQPLTEDYKQHVLKHIEEGNAERSRRISELQKNAEELERIRGTISKALLDFRSLIPRVTDMKKRLVEEQETRNSLEKEFEEHRLKEETLRVQLEEVRSETSKFDVSQLENARQLHEAATKQYHTIKAKMEYSEGRRKEAASRIEDFRERLERAQHKMVRVRNIEKLLHVADDIRNAYRSIQPRLRTEFVRILERMVQQVLDSLAGEEGQALIARIDETYTPYIRSQEGYELEASYLSGGERTLLAFAYRFALGQLIMQARTGHGLQMLLLDEPTESLGREDRSVDRLAEAIARLKAIEQIIAVTHNEAFAEKAEHVLRLEKEANASRVSSEK